MWGGSRKSKLIPAPPCNARLKFCHILTPPPLRGEENAQDKVTISIGDGGFDKVDVSDVGRVKFIYTCQY